MRKMVPSWSNCFSLLALVLAHQVTHASSRGVCFGSLGDNLPSATDIIALYKNHTINKMRLFHPNPTMQDALKLSDINPALGVKNEDLLNLAGSLDAALGWVNTTIVHYKDTGYQYLTVGNEAIPGVNSKYIAPAMKNLREALNTFKLYDIRVTTAVSTHVLGSSFPPSAGSFSNKAISDMTDIILLLANLGPKNPQHVLMFNVYPYFAYVADPDHISLDYAQFSTTGLVFNDGNLEYWNLFDAMVDAFYTAMEKVGGANVGISISETGWPSAGNGNSTTPALAQRYNLNFINHIEKFGTPKRPNDLMDWFLFAMFNEDEKTPGIEQNFGLFYPNGQPVYPLFRVFLYVFLMDQ